MAEREWRPSNRGLGNLGNTCYMNAALQCMIHTTELSRIFLNKLYKTDLHESNPQHALQLAESFDRLVQEMHGPLLPGHVTSFRSGVATTTPSFFDPHDFKKSLTE